MKFFAGNSSKNQPTDRLEIKIFQEQGDRKKTKSLALSGEGSWLEGVFFKGDTYWDINMQPIEEWSPIDDELLESDSYRREDKVYMITERWEEAEIAKETMENIQRQDKKLRDAAKQNRQARKQ